MSPNIIVSYDGTPNDDDALALGRMLAASGASLALAYVRHSREYDFAREELAQHDAERRLEHGASGLGDPGIARHVVLSASTKEGLAGLAEREGASMIVFGSDYRITPGHVEPGATAQSLLEGGPVAIAVAPAGLRTARDGVIKSIAVGASEANGDGLAAQTAQSLAEKLGATLVSPDQRPDLLVVGSQPSAPQGRIALSGAVRSQLNSARSSVLVLPQGTSIAF
jgi:nucleotide-binding universal stress UspA family protein